MHGSKGTIFSIEASFRWKPAGWGRVVRWRSPAVRASVREGAGGRRRGEGRGDAVPVPCAGRIGTKAGPLPKGGSLRREMQALGRDRSGGKAWSSDGSGRRKGVARLRGNRRAGAAPTRSNRGRPAAARRRAVAPPGRMRKALPRKCGRAPAMKGGCQPRYRCVAIQRSTVSRSARRSVTFFQPR